MVAHSAVERSGVFPDTESLISEAVIHLKVVLESRNREIPQEWLGFYGGHPAGVGEPICVRVPRTVFDSFASLSESTGENMFALAVMMHLDRLRQLRRD